MKISVFSLAVTITGTFIGAGFVSGQELWQFFGSFGFLGVVGFVLAILLMSLLSAITLHIAVKIRSNSFTDMFSVLRLGFFKKIVTCYQFLFYIALYIIMTAGIQSLFFERFNINKVISGLIFVTVITTLSFMGVKSILSFFSAVIPILIIATVIIAGYIIYAQPIEIFSESNNNSLLSNWLLSSLLYVSFNFSAGIGVFASVGRVIKSKKQLLISSVLAFLLLTILGLSVLLPIYATKTQSADMPMLEAAMRISPAVGFIYEVLLVLALSGAGISSLFPLAEWIRSKIQNKAFSVLSVCALSLATAFCGSFGFSKLVGTVYPIFGYLGVVVIVFILYSFLVTKKRSN